MIREQLMKIRPLQASAFELKPIPPASGPSQINTRIFGRQFLVAVVPAYWLRSFEIVAKYAAFS